MMHNCYFIMYATRFFRYKMNLQMNYSNRNFISTTLYILKLTLNLSQKQKQSINFQRIQPRQRFFRVAFLQCSLFIILRFFLGFQSFIVQSFYRVAFLECSVFIALRFYKGLEFLSCRVFIVQRVYMVAFLQGSVLLGYSVFIYGSVFIVLRFFRVAF